MRSFKASKKGSIQQLTEVIDQHYSNLSPRKLDRLSSEYSESMMDMFEIKKIKGNQIELVHIFNDLKYFPVILRKELVGLVRLKQVFLMTIARRNGRWHILYMSPPYHEETFISDVQERLKL